MGLPLRPRSLHPTDPLLQDRRKSLRVHHRPKTTLPAPALLGAKNASRKNFIQEAKLAARSATPVPFGFIKGIIALAHSW